MRREAKEIRLRGGIGNAVYRVEGDPRATIDLELGTTEGGGSICSLEAKFEVITGPGNGEGANERGSQIDLDGFGLEAMKEGKSGGIREVVGDTDLETVTPIREGMRVDRVEGIAEGSPEGKVVFTIEGTIEDGKFELILIRIIGLPLEGEGPALVETSGRHLGGASDRSSLSLESLRKVVGGSLGKSLERNPCRQKGQ
jgi:hypothetical protein